MRQKSGTNMYFADPETDTLTARPPRLTKASYKIAIKTFINYILNVICDLCQFGTLCGTLIAVILNHIYC